MVGPSPAAVDRVSVGAPGSQAVASRVRIMAKQVFRIQAPRAGDVGEDMGRDVTVPPHLHTCGASATTARRPTAGGSPSPSRRLAVSTSQLAPVGSNHHWRIQSPLSCQLDEGPVPESYEGGRAGGRGARSQTSGTWSLRLRH